MKKYITMVMIAALCGGCASLWTGVVTMTQVRDKAMTELAQLNKAGKISAETDKKIAAADLAYRQAAETAEKALIAYQSSGDKGQYLAALEAVRVATGSIIDILFPLVPQSEGVELQSQLLKASAL